MKKCINGINALINWWLSKSDRSQVAIAIVCASTLSYTFKSIHQLLEKHFPTVTDLVMFFIGSLILLFCSYCITTTLRSKKKEEELKNKFEEAAVRDPLTNLYNRRSMVVELSRLCKRVNREQRKGNECSVVIIFMDMNNLKVINDTYGHRAGDDAIRTVGGVISNELRDGEDYVCRYGGDEFCAAAILSGYTNDRERIKQIAAITYRLKSSIKKAFLFSGESRIQLSITIGMRIADTTEDVELELEKADAQLIEKKKRRKIGRNA